MKKFEIWFGKDPEDLKFEYCWPDISQDTAEFKDKYVAEIFSTDDENEFWNKFINVVLDPITMWYWVIIDGITNISGAIDPYDIYCRCVPNVVRDRYIEKKKERDSK